MNILLISQCSKNARVETCRILDQFAERKGDAAWQTAITLEGLTTLRRLLRKTARRNTAVACHWIKGANQTELLWIVGNLRRFSATGAVATNRTSRDILRYRHESGWRSTESIALLAGIAGLFHDFGKAGALFQDNLLDKKCTRRYQPFRHEWISVRLFQAFIGSQTDGEWLAKLGTLAPEDDATWLAHLHKDGKTFSDSPFTGMPPLAQAVAWLILSHHRLPQFLGEQEPSLSDAESWLTNQLNVSWNALNHLGDWKERDFHTVWTFPGGLPLQSHTWRRKAQQLARRAQHAVSLQEFGSLNQALTVHLARLALMLADHYYSAHQPVTGWQDEHYNVWANTDRQTGKPKQKLDEHTAGVSHHAFLIGRTFSELRSQLPAITRHKGFRERAKKEQFRWQNRAWDVAESLRERARKQGFFGINMASTGCGKTFANARIMYALAQEEQGCRFTVALGLRTLTLQTGDALRSRLGLGEDDLAVLIGSSAVGDLHQDDVQAEDRSSVSAEELFESHQYVHYDGVTNSGPLRQWLQKDAKLRQLVDAPLLVATIDHLMPATEGVRGGRQIAPMLRLLTSDLVLDEPDDFDIDDQHALCRLVNWAGMLGGKVLLSSATLPPALVQALFTAYCTGRRAYQQACGEPGQQLNVCCAWFDEDDARPGEFSNPNDFYLSHCEFAARRAKRLAGKPVFREASLIKLSPPSSRPEAIIGTISQALNREMFALHDKHSERYGDRSVSLGLVRMANINPLVATAQALMQIPSPEGYCIHYCVYHSQHPLLMRSHMEKRLDAAFTRHAEGAVWCQSSIRRAVERSAAQHHLFVVLATSVVEVGRDWDADWGIIEPSSMRSLIQFAGRIQRHRQKTPQGPNMLILNKNVRGYGQKKPAMCRPGFETKDFPLASHDLSEILRPEQYRYINAAPRIVGIPPGQIDCYSSLVDLEHGRSWQELMGKNKPVKDKAIAADWWRKSIGWNGELQRRKPFRRSQPEKQFFLRMEEEFDEPKFMFCDEVGESGWKEAGVFTRQALNMATGVAAWMEDDYAQVMQQTAEARGLELKDVSDRYGEINLRVNNDEMEAWLWHPLLGVFRALG